MTGSIITQDVSKCEIKDGNEKKESLYKLFTSLVSLNLYDILLR